MIARILVLLFWGVPCMAQFDEGPWEHMPREYARSGPWTLVSAVFSNTLHLKMRDDSGVSTPIDTLYPPGSPWMSRLVGGVLPVDGGQGKFLVSTTDYEDSSETLWEFNAEDRRFREVLTDRDGFGVMVSGCRGTRVLLSRSHYWFMGREISATTLLVDSDSGKIVREWKGLDVRTGGPSRYPRYDRKTEAFWCFPAPPTAAGPSAPCRPNHTIRIECATGDTTVLHEDQFLGEGVEDYWVYDMYKGCLFVSALRKADEVGVPGERRALLVDVVEKRVLGEWDPSSFRNTIEGTVRISEDCSGIVYSERDSSGAVRRRFLRTGQAEPTEVDWVGKRGP